MTLFHWQWRHHPSYFHARSSGLDEAPFPAIQHFFPPLPRPFRNSLLGTFIDTSSHTHTHNTTHDSPREGTQHRHYLATIFAQKTKHENSSSSSSKTAGSKAQRHDTSLLLRIISLILIAGIDARSVRVRGSTGNKSYRRPVCTGKQTNT